MTAKHAERVLTVADVAALAQVKVETVRQYRLRGTMPEPDGMTGRTPWWLRPTIDAWMQERRATVDTHKTVIVREAGYGPYRWECTCGKVGQWSHAGLVPANEKGREHERRNWNTADA